MVPHSFLWHYLWIAPHALQIIVAIIMVRRGLVRDFPVFFAYTIFQVVEEGTLFILDHSAAISAEQYWSVRWVGLGLDVALRFAIIFEIFSGVFRNYPGLRQLTRVFFLAATVVLLFAAVVVAAQAPDDGTFPLLSRIHLLDLSVVVMQSGLLMLLVGFSSYFALSWRSPAYGIAFGLGIFASVRLATETMRVWTGSMAGYAFDFVTMATYHCCVVIWLVYLLAPEAARPTVKELPENGLEQWNAELLRHLLQ
ncbi:MAG: hypothetical protein ACRD20_11080 [Terriglobales bacterium]